MSVRAFLAGTTLAAASIAIAAEAATTSASASASGAQPPGRGRAAAAAVGSGSGSGPSDDEVSAAIDRGLSWLRERQNADGSWSFGGHTLGMTALAALAMLENGTPPDDPAVRRAEAWVLERLDAERQTYDLSLALLLLSRGSDAAEARGDVLNRTARRLIAGCRGGMWTYACPDVDESTLRARIEAGFDDVPKIGDNSNTQFALLGLWAAGRAGIEVDAPLAAIDRHFRATQAESGDWGYTPGGGGSPAMSCAGLMGLAIGAARPELAALKTSRARGAALAGDPVFRAGLEAVSRAAPGQVNPSADIYYLWSLERVCVALGLLDLNGFDWYAAGASSLLATQLGNGGWPQNRWGDVPSTALALLFLRKANLAFELDRVLRLPKPGEEFRESRPSSDGTIAGEGGDSDLIRASARRSAAEGDDPAGSVAGDDGVVVTVRGADESRFPEITLDFEVRGPDGQPFPDAVREDFRVTEYDRDVEIIDFQSPRAEVVSRPITVALVLDRSGSMQQEDRIGGLKRAVSAFLEKLPEGSRVAVIAFSSDVEVLDFGGPDPFTEDFQRVRERVQTLAAFGSTRYYDAVVEALELLAGREGRRAVLALTDGEDTFSRFADIETAIQAARRLGLPVHTLGLGSEDEIETDELRRMAAETRGQYRSAREVDQLAAIYQELAASLRDSYSLTYRTDRPLPDGTLRPVKLYYRKSARAAESQLYIPGMVVPATGWSPLFLLIVGGLALLARAGGGRGASSGGGGGAEARS